MITLPNIGQKGHYEFYAPFENYGLLNTQYVCQAKKSLIELEANKDDPKESIYIANNIESEYYADLANNVTIISLQASNGSWLILPARYIKNIPNNSGVGYNNVMLGIALPAMPVIYNYSDILSTITDIVRELVGVEATTEVVEISPVVVVDVDKHKLIEATKNSVMNDELSCLAKYRKSTVRLDALLLKVKKLEKWIIDTIPNLPAICRRNVETVYHNKQYGMFTPVNCNILGGHKITPNSYFEYE